MSISPKDSCNRRTYIWTDSEIIRYAHFLFHFSSVSLCCPTIFLSFPSPCFASKHFLISVYLDKLCVFSFDLNLSGSGLRNELIKIVWKQEHKWYLWIFYFERICMIGIYPAYTRFTHSGQFFFINFIRMLVDPKFDVFASLSWGLLLNFNAMVLINVIFKRNSAFIWTRHEHYCCFELGTET